MIEQFCENYELKEIESILRRNLFSHPDIVSFF